MAPTEQSAERTTGCNLCCAAWWLFAALLLPMLFVHHPATGWNVNTRLDLVFAIMDQGTLAIDDYHDLPPYDTGDKAFFEGHYYSDKIFGVSLLALPVYGMMKLAWGIAGNEPGFQAASYLLRVVAVSVPAAFTGMMIWLLMVRLGAAPRRAMVALALAFLGSMMYGYGTVFYPYLTGMAAAMGALWLILYPPAKRLTLKNSAAIGALLGYALLCDLIFGILVDGIIVVYVLRLVDQAGFFGMRAFADMTGPRTTLRNAPKLLVAAAIAGAVPLALFALYSVAIFGSPTIPYEYEADQSFREGMAKGFMGVTTPKLAPLYFITLHPYRGVFFWCPILVLAVIGLVLGTRETGRRRVMGWLGLYALVAYLLFNAGYYMWWGGWCMGPRFLLPMFVVVVPGLAELCRRDRAPGWWWAVLGAGAVSVALSLPLSMTDPQVPMRNPDPVLREAAFSTELEIPQWDRLKHFYTMGRVEDTPGFGQVSKSTTDFAMFFLGLAGAAGLIVVAMRKCPEKELNYERAEVPFKVVDGTAAPPPVPMAR